MDVQKDSEKLISDSEIFFGLRPGSIKSPSRVRRVAAARHHFYRQARKCGFTLVEIAAAAGRNSASGVHRVFIAEALKKRSVKHNE